MSLSVVVLAAGRGLRMRSDRPKMLHTIGGISLISRILTTANELNPQKIIVVCGYQGDQLKNSLESREDIAWVTQAQQLGTGHAALEALPFVGEVERVLIQYGDIPLIRSETLTRLLNVTPKNGIGLVTVEVNDPSGLGRIVRDEEGRLVRIVEEKEATAAEKKIKEINTGFFIVPKRYLEEWLPKIKAAANQQEYLLTDVITMADEMGISITTVSPRFEWEVLGVNDKIQLASLERYFQQSKARELMEKGVTLLDPARFDVRGTVTVGKDVVIDVNVILEGEVNIGDRVTIGPNVCLKNATIEADSIIYANCVITDATIGKKCHVGPFARVRPGTVLSSEVRLGNFVEVKNTTIGANSKINHLSYIGDAALGEQVNIGAGTITCNYDGNKKHKTHIGNKVSVGANSQLIAPLNIGDSVTIGAGTTVTRDIPANHLVHNRIEHRTVANWEKADKELE